VDPINDARPGAGERPGARYDEKEEGVVHEKVEHDAAAPVRMAIALLVAAVGSLATVGGAWLLSAGTLGAAAAGTVLMAVGVVVIALAFEA
jgi:hypothetical protein